MNLFKDFEMRRLSWIIHWALNPMMCPYKGRGEGAQDRQQRRRRRRGGGDGTTEAETSDGATRPGVLTGLEAERQSKDPPWSIPRECGPANTLVPDF